MGCESNSATLHSVEGKFVEITEYSSLLIVSNMYILEKTVSKTFTVTITE